MATHAPQPRLDFPVDTNCPFGGYSVGARSVPKPPEAHIKVTFVRFDDGSVWGDDKTVAEVMFQRTETLKYLHSLRDAHSGGGDYALYQALQAPVSGPDHRHRHMVRGTRLTLLNLNNAKAAADAIDKDLATAEARAAWLK